MTRTSSVLLAASLWLGGTATAQNLAGEFSPKAPLPGQAVTFTMTDATGAGLNLSSPCTWYSIHWGSQAGPVIQLGLFCPAVIVPVPPNGNAFFTWDQTDINGRTVPPGTYWVEARAWDAGFNRQFSDWFCVNIQPAGDPALNITGNPQVGQTATLDVNSPSDPGGIYFLALSASANSPLQIQGLDTCLSAPLITSGLSSVFGPLDGAGQGPAINLTLPNLPSLAFQGFHAQAAILSQGVWKTTNGLALTIRP